jgi:hypothetical protein
MMIANSEPPPNKQHIELSYLAESQTRLGVVSVYLWTRYESTGPLQYQVLGRQTLFVLYHQASYHFTLPFPVSHSRGLHTLEGRQGHWQFKLPIDTKTPDRNKGNKGLDDVAAAAAPFNASALQTLQPLFFICNTCTCQIADTRRIEKYTSLPSQHWEELIDAWLCHADQELSQGMIDAQKKLQEHLGLLKDQGRVSESCIIMHPSHLTGSVASGDQEMVSVELPSSMDSKRKSAPCLCFLC